MNYKAQSLPLNTIVILIVILVAVVLILIFISKSGSDLFGVIGQNVNSTITISQDVPKIQP